METQTQTQTKIYRIPEANVNKFMDKINKFVRKANKLSVQPIKIECIGEEFKTDEITGKSYKYVNYSVTGEKPIITGWMFLGSLDITDVGTIVRTIPGIELPAKYREITKSRCDHCHKQIRRVNHHIVQHTETKEIKVVGSSCLGDFIGSDVSRQLAYCEYLLRIDEEGINDEDMDYGGSGGKTYVSLLGYLSYVAMVIRLSGWISRKAAQEWNEKYNTAEGESQYYKTATADSAVFAMWSKKHDKEYPVTEDVARAEKAIQWVRDTLSATARSDYEYNLVTLVKADYVPEKAYGLAASIIPAYYRAVGIEVGKKYAKVVSQYVGKEKDKLETKVEIVRALAMDSDYGVRCMYRMVDENGNILIWWASKIIYFDGIELDAGHKITIKGTVKKLEEYHGTKQTILTRCKVLELHNKEEMKQNN